MKFFGYELKKVKPIQDAINAALVQRQFADLARKMKEIAVYPTWKTNEIHETYCSVDDVYSLIRRLVTASIKISIFPYEEKDKIAAKKLMKLSSNAKSFERKAYKTKALEDLEEGDPAYDLLENPSDVYSKYEFYEALYTLLYTVGEVVIYKERGIIKNQPRKLHILLPQHVILIVSQTWPLSIVGYKFVVEGQTIMEFIPPEDIIHIKYFNPKFSVSGDGLRGLSPIKVLTNRLTRMEGNMNASVAQLQNGGVPGIVFDKKAQTEEDAARMDQHKDNFYRYLSNAGNKGAPYFAGGEMGYIALGLPLADMEVAALDKIDFKKLCNAYSVSDRILNNDATGSEVSDDNANKSLYTNACLPNVERVASSFQKSLRDDFKDKERVYYADISDIEELQENYKEMADWLNVAWWVLPNEKREIMKFDRHENAIFDTPLLPTGLQTIDDLMAVDDLPDLLNEYDNGSRNNSGV